MARKFTHMQFCWCCLVFSIICTGFNWRATLVSMLTVKETIRSRPAELQPRGTNVNVVEDAKPELYRTTGAPKVAAPASSFPKPGNTKHASPTNEKLTVQSGSLSLKQSFGLLDHTDEEWRFKRMIHVKESGKDSAAHDMNETKIRYWNTHYSPSVSCKLKTRIGHYGDGGKWICNVHKLRQDVLKGHKCLIYSIGSAGDYSFERALLKTISSKCEIHTVDPQKYWPPQPIKFHNVALGIPGNESRGPARVFTMPQLVKMNGHTGRTIDLFKIDCEGCEYLTFPAWFGANVDIRQILIEVHWRSSEQAEALFKFLFKQGYAVFSREPNTVGCGGGCVEYSLIKLDASFGSLPLADKNMLLSNSQRVSFHESLGFIDESDDDWPLRKQIHQAQMSLERHIEDRKIDQISGRSWWQIHHEPSFTCSFERRLGRLGDGGKWICDPHRLSPGGSSQKECLVYSSSTIGDYSFEEELLSDISPRCEIHVLAPVTGCNVTHAARPPNDIHFHPGMQIGSSTTARLSDTVRELGHSGRRVDVLKIHSGGECFWQTWKNWLDVDVDVRQILVDLFYPFRSARFTDASELFKTLYDAGYVVVHKEPTIKGRGIGTEYVFLKMHKDFSKS